MIMRHKYYTRINLLVLLLVIILPVRPALAALGETASSIKADKKALSAFQSASTLQNGYTVHELSSCANTIREYVAPSGVVFAITWSGLSHPDLTSLLGKYFDEYTRALQQTPRERGKRYFRVKTDSIIVDKWGHMRSLHGRAYIPSLIPNGVTIDDIK